MIILMDTFLKCTQLITFFFLLKALLIHNDCFGKWSLLIVKFIMLLQVPDIMKLRVVLHKAL